VFPWRMLFAIRAGRRRPQPRYWQVLAQLIEFAA
jgi:hypothetical protein